MQINIHVSHLLNEQKANIVPINSHLINVSLANHHLINVSLANHKLIPRQAMAPEGSLRAPRKLPEGSQRGRNNKGAACEESELDQDGIIRGCLNSVKWRKLWMSNSTHSMYSLEASHLASILDPSAAALLTVSHLLL